LASDDDVLVGWQCKMVLSRLGTKQTNERWPDGFVKFSHFYKRRGPGEHMAPTVVKRMDGYYVG
jgi:hypothetical protein